MSNRTDWHKHPVDQGALQVEVPLDGVEAGALAVQRGRDTRSLLESSRDLRKGVGLAVRRSDTGRLEEVVSGEGLRVVLVMRE